MTPPSCDLAPGKGSSPLEPFLDAFAEAWQSDLPPAIERFLPLVAADRPATRDHFRREVLEELIKIDLEYRWQPRHPPTECLSQPADRPPESNHFPPRPRLDDYVAHYP